MIPKLRRALVTGANGFLGCHLLRELERYGVGHRAGAVLGRITFRRNGISALARRLPGWILEMAEPDVVFHLAGGAAGYPAELGSSIWA